MASADATITEDNAGTGKTYNNQDIYGNNDGSDYTNSTGTPTNQKVTVTGGTIKNANGSYISTGDATYNTVDFSGNATIADKIFGGYANNGNATYNIINISGGTINTSANGGFIDISGNASNNTVNITGGNIKTINGGATINGDAKDNAVTISGTSNITDSVTGGYTGLSGLASGNIVNIAGGTINGTVIGGRSVSGDANGNTVTISGGTITGMVTGGKSTNGNANDNTVNLLAAMTLAGINGGSQGATGTSTGNTLNVAAKGITVTDNIYGFQNLNFYLPSGVSSGDTMLTINGGTTDLTGVTFGVAALTGVSLAVGDTVNLITNSNGLTTDSTLTTTKLTSAPAATSLTVDTAYTLSISKSGENTLIATVDSTETSDASERAKSLVETRAATTTFLNSAMDMLAGQGFTQAANAVALAAAENAHGDGQGETNSGAGTASSGFTPFAAFGGSAFRAQSGSHVDTKGFGLNVGFAKETVNSQGKLLWGPFIEYGGGSYDSYLDDGTHADGGTHFWGGGIMAQQVNNDGLYYEASLRGGKVNSDYNGTLDGIGKVSYDSSSPYFAAHTGIGKVFDIGHSNTIDGYLKYFYSHQGGDDATIHLEGLADEKGSFDSVNSHRLRAGFRLTHKLDEKSSLYGGLAYQYEFNGDARATFNGTAAPAPSLKGSSGMLELGWQVKPDHDDRLTLDLGLTGWAGKQRGISGQLGATWKF